MLLHLQLIPGDFCNPNEISLRLEERSREEARGLTEQRGRWTVGGARIGENTECEGCADAAITAPLIFPFSKLSLSSLSCFSSRFIEGKMSGLKIPTFSILEYYSRGPIVAWNFKWAVVWKITRELLYQILFFLLVDQLFS